MRAGVFNEPITIQKNDFKRTESGSLSNNWIDHIHTRASLAFTKGDRKNSADEIVNYRYAEFRIRLHHQIDPKMRIVHHGLKYGIISAFPDRKTQAWIIHTEQINE